MKSKIIPFLMFCLLFSWIVARVFQSEGAHEISGKNPKERIRQELPGWSDNNTADQPAGYDGLSTKQINYLIP